jgi:hypothetical protein
MARSKNLAEANEGVLVPPGAGPQLTNEQQQVVQQIRDQIVQARMNKGFDFLRQAGRIVVKHLWEGDACKSDKTDPRFIALVNDKELRVSQSSLWYAVRLQDPDVLFGVVANQLSPSHQRRLLHVSDAKRQELAQAVVDEKLTVEQLEDRIQQARLPGEGQQKRGAKPLPATAKRFTAMSSAATELIKFPAGELEGLGEKKAKAMYDNVQALKALMQDWLPAFEAELARIGKVQG